jgi:hypothetical protein
MNIINQLIDIYHKHEIWHRKKLSIDDSKEYFIRLLSSGNIIIFMDGDKLCGYVEFWRVNPEQFRKILDKNFYVFDENISDGSICYISALFVHKEYRRSIAIKYLKQIFMNINRDCTFFIGHETNYNNRIRIMENIYGS